VQDFTRSARPIPFSLKFPAHPSQKASKPAAVRVDLTFRA